ncbi:MAG: hypothetical protein ACI4J5_05745 [Oscillospiraceae bacterium]
MLVFYVLMINANNKDKAFELNAEYSESYRIGELHIRQNICMGDTDNAKALLASFEKTAKNEGLRRLYPDIDAKYYAEHCDRKYPSMKLGLLTSVIRYRTGNEWQSGFIEMFEKICRCVFISQRHLLFCYP